MHVYVGNAQTGGGGSAPDLVVTPAKPKSGDVIAFTMSQPGKLHWVIAASLRPKAPSEMKIPEDSDMRHIGYGPRSQESVDKGNAQLDYFANTLIKRGIQVDRPTALDLSGSRNPGLEKCLHVRLYAAPRCAFDRG